MPTADEQIFPPGTAFISDVGMTGPYDSILGRRVDRVLSTTVTFVPSAFDVASVSTLDSGRRCTTFNTAAVGPPLTPAVRPVQRLRRRRPRVQPDADRPGRLTVGLNLT